MSNETPERKKKPCSVVGVAVVLLIVVTCCGGGTWIAVQARHTAHYMICSNNMTHWVGIAIKNYHDHYDQFPPAVLIDHESGAESSWRVACMPFCVHEAFYEEYRHDEPWDSDHNLKLAEEWNPEFFTCPASGPKYKTVKGRKILCTNYVMITGRGTIGEGTDLKGITDGLSNTILLIEITGDDLPAWTEPVDLSIEDLLKYGVNNDDAPMRAGSPHPSRGPNACMADGSAISLPKTIDADTLRKLAIRNDGEELPEDWRVD